MKGSSNNVLFDNFVGITQSLTPLISGELYTPVLDGQSLAV